MAPACLLVGQASARNFSDSPKKPTVELPPGTTARMAVGAQIAQTEPPPVITTGMRTEVLGGIHSPGTAVGRRHGIGPSRRR